MNTRLLILTFCGSLNAIQLLAQPSQAVLQSVINAGGATGSFHPSTTIPTHFSSVGQPIVMPRLSATNSGAGVMNANDIMFPTSTVLAAPTTQASNLVITQPFTNTLQLTWTNGNGQARIVVGKAGPTVDQAPIDDITYFASSSFTVGDDLGGGNYVVYKGTGNMVSVTDIQENTLYTFFVFEYNGVPGSEKYNITPNPPNNPKSFTTSGPGLATPTLALDNTPTSVSPGNSILVSAQFSPASSITGVVLDYRSVSAGGSPVTPPMTLNGANWELTIQAADVGELGIEYRMTATNAAGSSDPGDYKNVKVDHSSSQGLTIPYTSFGNQQSSYRIVSVPLDLANKTMNSVFGTHLGTPYDGIGWRMFRWSGSQTMELSTSTLIEPGKGYWLLIRENKGVSLTSGAGTTVPATSQSPFTLQNIAPEWYQVGNPYPFNLLWSDVQAANPGLPGLRIFEGSFTDGTILKAFSGGFFKLASGSSPIDLVFPVTKNPSAGRVREKEFNALDQPNWQVGITLTHGQLSNDMGGIGMNEKAVEGFDVLDGFTMPRIFEDFLEVNHLKKDGNSFFTKDIIPTKSNHVWEFSIASSGKEDAMTFNWDNSYFGTNDRELYWMDVGTGKSFDMRTTSHYTFNKNISGPFKIIYGDKSFIKENTMVDRLMLHGAYPIPSDEEVTISFSLPGSDETVASVEVHDLLGRQIWMIEKLFSPGYNEVKWIRNGEAPGIYLARISAGRVSRQTRLTVR